MKSQPGGSYTRAELEGDTAFAAAEAVLTGTFGAPPREEEWADVYGEILHAVLSDLESVERITHGRHCTCTPCRAEDWARPELAPCGMHGSDCPPRHEPLGRAGQEVRSVA